MDPTQVKNWFCIVFLIVIQTSYLTPPMAPAIFYLRGISPPEIRLMDMYRGVMPFIALEVIALAMVMALAGPRPVAARDAVRDAGFLARISAPVRRGSRM